TSINFDLGPDMGQWPGTLETIRSEWAAIYPEEELDIQFMDELIAGFYNRERSTVQLLQWATALAVFISCLGLLGLAVHTTERRVKEIGLRKVLGASLSQLGLLL